MTACGVVGAGAIGRGVVASLVRAGFPVTVYDLDADAAAQAASAGAACAGSLAELAQASEVVLLALPDTPEIVAALDGGLEEGLRRGSTVIVTSTVSPDTPVELERRRPVLEALASHLVHVGPTGHGELAKLVNNLMGAVIILGISEGLALAAKAGVDVRRVCEAVSGGSGSSWILREWIPDTAFRGDYERRFSLDLMSKDMGLIAGLAADLEVPVAALELAAATFRSAIDAGYGSHDFSVVAALQARAAGTELPGGPPPTPSEPPSSLTETQHDRC